jgi:2-dehydro-3-deoxyphosphogluconate aldolase/(4S)-4-hydroxy-2-oxoglutarate aldolase
MMKMDFLANAPSIIVTLDSDALLFENIKQVADAGFSMIEINRIDSSILERVLERFPRMTIGVGNIVSLQQLDDAYRAGAHFATSPGLLPSLVQTAQVYVFPYLPGVATLSEAMHAFSLGCDAVKPFPATVSFCSLLHKYLPLLRLFPAEVVRDDVERFLKVPTVSSVSLINPEIHQLRTLETI